MEGGNEVDSNTIGLRQTQLKSPGLNRTSTLSKKTSESIETDGVMGVSHTQDNDVPVRHSDVQGVTEDTYESLDRTALRMSSQQTPIYAEINSDMWNHIFPVPPILPKAGKEKTCSKSNFRANPNLRANTHLRVNTNLRVNPVLEDIDKSDSNVNILPGNKGERTLLNLSVCSTDTDSSSSPAVNGKPTGKNEASAGKYSEIDSNNRPTNQYGAHDSHNMGTMEGEYQTVEDTKNSESSAVMTVINFNCLCRLWIVGLSILAAVVVTVLVGFIFYRMGSNRSNQNINTNPDVSTPPATNESCSTLTDTVKSFGLGGEHLNLTAFTVNTTVLRVVMANGRITGLTALNNTLFVVRDGLSVGVDVYDSKNFTLLRSLSLPAYARPWAILANPQYNYLYMTDTVRNVIYLYNLSSNVVTNWTIGGICYGLFLTSSLNILATLNDVSRVEEYTAEGCFVQGFGLDSSIQYPFHCVQLSSGLFGVIHQGAVQVRVCVVDQRGSVIQCYGAPPVPGTAQPCLPAQIAIDRSDNMLVTDTNRVELLNSTLNHIGYTVLPGYEITGPYAIHFDGPNRRLYIGEWWGRRIFVLQA